MDTFNQNSPRFVLFIKPTFIASCGGGGGDGSNNDQETKDGPFIYSMWWEFVDLDEGELDMLSINAQLNF